MRAAGQRLAGPGRVYWTTQDSPHWSGDKFASFPMIYDGETRETSARLAASGGLRELRIDPGTGLIDNEGYQQGVWRAEWIELWREIPHPLEIELVISDDCGYQGAKFGVRNTTCEPVEFSHEIKLGNEVGVAAQGMQQKMLVTAGDVDIPERLTG